MGYSLSAAVQLQGSTTRIYPTSVPYGAGFQFFYLLVFYVLFHQAANILFIVFTICKFTGFES
jgi:hypothetical protein